MVFKFQNTCESTTLKYKFWKMLSWCTLNVDQSGHGRLYYTIIYVGQSEGCLVINF